MARFERKDVFRCQQDMREDSMQRNVEIFPSLQVSTGCLQSLFCLTTLSWHILQIFLVYFLFSWCLILEVFPVVPYRILKCFPPVHCVEFIVFLLIQKTSDDLIPFIAGIRLSGRGTSKYPRSPLSLRLWFTAEASISLSFTQCYIWHVSRAVKILCNPLCLFSST